ncbi:MAG: protein-disulfide reductase DsbD [Pseudomonadota bacterium]
MHIIGASLTALTFGLWGANASGAEFLAPEQAFQITTEVRDARSVVVSWTIAPHYHLYRERLGFKAEGGAVLAEPKLPAGVRTFDENFNKEMEIYENSLVVQLPVSQAGAAPFALKVDYQGCADAGLCYPPAQASYRIDLSTPGVVKALPATDGAPGPVLSAALAATPAAAPLAGAAPLSAPAASVSAVAATSAAPDEDDSSLAQRTLQSGNLWRIGAAFLVFGLLLSFTPCVLPMVPILSSIIVGEGTVSRSRGLLLASAYCLGMALVYTALGVGAGLAGEGLAGALQKPWVLLTFGALLVGLALSMFDVYQLQLPSSLQTSLSQTGGQGGGRFIGVFVMGALSALIVGPCVAGPLAGALLYISQTRNAWIGGWALFFMAVGMSVPLLLTGLSAGSLLPRAGAWMNHVKKVFGLLLIAVAIWMISPVFSTTVMMVLWGGFAILCAVFLRVGEALPPHATLSGYVGKMLGLVFFVIGLFELTGAASSGKDILQPLSHLGVGTAANTAGATAVGATPSGARFTRVRNLAELEQTLAASKTPAMLDFYADWCVSCKEMEHNTFSDPKVGAAMNNIRLLQVDVTANNAEDRALMKKFSLFGPPGIILFNKNGAEIPNSRVIGYLAPEPFLQRLQRAFSAG